jgi:hypothetical protein
MSCSRAFVVGAALLVWAATLGSAAEVVLPGNGFAPGWVTSGKPEVFPHAGLFNYIDGGAELFLEFGFKALTVQTYAKDGLELTVELYEMDGPESALGIYLLKAGRETPVKGLAARNTGDRFQITLLRDRWFVHINNADGLPEAVPAMTLLAEQLLAVLREGRPVILLTALPQHGLISGTERLFRGPSALQSIYTLGPGDILLQKSRVFGLAADYRNPDGGSVTRMFVTYETGPAAREAFEHLKQNLDSYLVVVESFAQGFIFHDFQDKYGRVELAGNSLEITVNLPTRPILEGRPRPGSPAAPRSSATSPGFPA